MTLERDTTPRIQLTFHTVTSASSDSLAENHQTFVVKLGEELRFAEPLEFSSISLTVDRIEVV